MSTSYYQFMSDGHPVTSEQCTTRWPESISCKVPIGGLIDATFYNVMVLEGPEEDILAWAKENEGKVEVMTREQANVLGQAIIPVGTERQHQNPDGESVTLIAGEFDVDTGTAWTVKS